MKYLGAPKDSKVEIIMKNYDLLYIRWNFSAP